MRIKAKLVETIITTDESIGRRHLTSSQTQTRKMCHNVSFRRPMMKVNKTELAPRMLDEQKKEILGEGQAQRFSKHIDKRTSERMPLRFRDVIDSFLRISSDYLFAQRATLFTATENLGPTYVVVDIKCVIHS